MFGLKIFVWVQTFRRVPPVLPRNFCHPESSSDPFGRIMDTKYLWLSTHMYCWAQYILAQKQIYQIVFVWERGKSRQRILKVFVPLSTVIQGGTMGGWGPDAEAKTAESFGTTFNLRRVIAILGFPPWLETPPGVLIPRHRRHRANWNFHTLDILYLLVLK